MEYGDELTAYPLVLCMWGSDARIAGPLRGTLAQGRPLHHPFGVVNASTWLRVLPQGLFCEPGGFFIDPVRAVDRAIVTHAHSDHARPGHHAVLASADTLA